jgi:hypothetical protein
MKRLCLAFGLAALVDSSWPAAAQQDSANARASIGVSLVPALSVQKTQDMIVGAFRPGGVTGTVEINVAGAASRTATGGVALAAGPFSAAEFSVAGAGGRPVHFTIDLPRSITIQRTGGSETMTVDAFRSNLSSDCGPGASGCGSPYTLLVGATLHVEANQKAGQYVGTFTVTVNQL